MAHCTMYTVSAVRYNRVAMKLSKNIALERETETLITHGVIGACKHPYMTLSKLEEQRNDAAHQDWELTSTHRFTALSIVDLSTFILAPASNTLARVLFSFRSGPPAA